MNDSTRLTRSGHLSELSLERVLVGELEGGELVDHLEGCAECAARLEAMRAFDVAHPTRPPQGSRNNPGPWIGLAVMAAAAGLFFMLRAGPVTPIVDDGIRLKGTVALEVFVHDGARERLALAGERVHPGDRLGFRAKAAAAGHLLIAGVDAKGVVYPCYPQASGTSAPFGPAEAARDVGEAVRLDAVLGAERIVALFCEAPVSLKAVEADLRGGGAPPGCVRRGLTLEKVAR